MGRNELKALLNKYGIRPTKKFGQNFCVDENLIDALSRDAQIGESDLVLEIGTGTGALTRELARLAPRVLSFEIDNALFKLASTELAHLENLTVIHADVLENKNKLNPVLVDAINKELATGKFKSLRVVANLPYNIATSLVIQLFEQGWPFAGMFILVQKEAAERFLATPGQKIYGAVSILIQSHCVGRIVRLVPREVFFPKPKIMSAFVELLPRSPEEMLSECEYDMFRKLVRDLFNHRRKTLNKAGKLAQRQHPEFSAFGECLEAVGVDPSERVENLSQEVFRELARQLLTRSQAAQD